MGHGPDERVFFIMKNFDFYLALPPCYFPDAAHSIAESLCCEMFGDPGSDWDIEHHPHNYTVLGFSSENSMQDFIGHWMGLLPAPVQLSSSPF
jgi:hypothetical protein